MLNWQERIKSAFTAKAEDFENVTPIYWKAEEGEQKDMILQGFKLITKKDPLGNVTGQDFAVVFHDGSREIVCNQISLKDAMKNKLQGTLFRIKCTRVVEGKAKKFEILELNN